MPHLADKELCTGCTACANICPANCIEMQRDENGFAYPLVSDTSLCTSCGMCEVVCPIQTVVQKSNREPLAFAAYSDDLDVRMDSSSGGIFSEVAKMVLENGGIVFGAAYDDGFGVYHTGIDNIEGLPSLRGAKYAESWLGNTFSSIQKELKSGRQVLFAGTPCQVAGLKAFLEKDYDNLFCIDFVCHSIPAPVAWKAFVKYRAQEDAEGKLPIKINLRSKQTGWSRYRYSNLFQYEDNQEYIVLSFDSLFMKLFVGDYISRISCENCSFKGYGRVSDLTLGDFWGIWDILPEMDDNKGTSVVLVQTEKGKAFWDEINTKIRFEEVSLDQVSKQNPSILDSSKAKDNKDEVLRRIREYGIDSCSKIFDEKRLSYTTKIKKRLIRLLKKQ